MSQKTINNIRQVSIKIIEANGYKIGNKGTILSLKGGKPRKLRPATLNTGHRVVNLRIGGVSTLLLVHRLVALKWVSNPLGKPLVNHLDGNPLNNRSDNLEWCTHSENIKHAYLIGAYD